MAAGDGGVEEVSLNAANGWARFDGSVDRAKDEASALEAIAPVASVAGAQLKAYGG